MPKPGDLVGNKYRIVRLIGDGGMGAVYEARHEVLGTAVALKFLHPELARRTGLASRFLQEAKVSASIQSLHVTRVTDVDTMLDGTPYMVMELLHGESLQQLLDRRHKLSVDQAVDFALQILSGLEAAHALGVVHRDLKPDNVYVTPSAGGPVLKLLDFGIAKLRETGEFKKGLTRAGAVMGTPEYMAPEQLYAANRVDHRADIYSLGTMLYEMLSGERPANGDDAAQIVAQVASGQIQRVDEREPTVPKGLADVVHRAIEADKTRRYASAMEMRLTLSEFAGPLSHAGRLAAMAVPVGSMPQPESPAPTVDTPPLSVARNVPATLPPVDALGAAHVVPVVTSAAPASHAAAHGAPPTIGAGKGAGAPATVSAMQVPGSPYSSPPRPDLPVKGATQEAPQGFTPFAQSAMPTPPPTAVTGYIPYPTITTPPRRPRRMLGFIFALLLGITVAGGLIAGILYMRPQSDAEPGASQSLPPPSTTLTAQEQPTTEPPPAAPRPPQSEPTVHPGTRPGGTGKPRTDGTGKDGGAAGGQTGPFPFPVPSGFPPIPSGFPQFPFPFPAPAPSK